MSRKTLSVFEHQTLVVGETSGEASSGVALREGDFDALVRFNDATGGRYFDVGYHRIKFRQYVGYIQVGSLGIEILPKPDRQIRERNEIRWRDGLLRMLEVALGVRLETSSMTEQSVSRSNLLDLVAMKLVTAAEGLLRHGLSKGYRDEERNGATFRGRLLVTQNVRENLVRRDRFYVRYQTYDHDVLVNRILGAALSAFRTLSVSSEVKARAVACHANFPKLSPIGVKSGDIDRIVLGRNTAHHREALVLARMILEQTAPRLCSGSVPVFGLLFDMNVLWERYVAALFRMAIAKLPGMVVSMQESVVFWKPLNNVCRIVRPDVVVKSAVSGKPLLVVDTKWKLTRDGAPSNEDLKQMFVYNELLDSPRAMLVFPNDNGAGLEQQGMFAERRHECVTLHLGLFDASGWSSARMLEQVTKTLGSVVP